MQASAVYCFRSLRTSIAGTSSAPIAASTPAAIAASRCCQPSCRANQYAITTAAPANASGMSRPDSVPGTLITRSSAAQPIGVLSTTARSCDNGNLVVTATQDSSSQNDVVSMYGTSWTTRTSNPSSSASRCSSVSRRRMAAPSLAGQPLEADADSASAASGTGGSVSSRRNWFRPP